MPILSPFLYQSYVNIFPYNLLTINNGPFPPPVTHNPQLPPLSPEFTKACYALPPNAILFRFIIPLVSFAPSLLHSLTPFISLLHSPHSSPSLLPSSTLFFPPLHPFPLLPSSTRQPTRERATISYTLDFLPSFFSQPPEHHPSLTNSHGDNEFARPIRNWVGQR